METNETDKQTVHKHPQVAAAWIGGITALAGTIATALITQHANQPAGPNANTAKSAATSTADQTSNQRADVIDMKPPQLADGSTKYYATLYPPPPGKKPGLAVDQVFRSPKDSRKWVELNIGKGTHFKEAEIAINDSLQGSGHLELKANDVSENKHYEIKTDTFTVSVTPIEASTGADTDPTAPLAGKVFKKLYLQITASESEQKPRKILGFIRH